MDKILNESRERAAGECASLAWLLAGPSCVHTHTHTHTHTHVVAGALPSLERLV